MTETTLPRSWKRDYLELQSAISAFLSGPLAQPHNRVAAMLAKKLEAARCMLGMEVNGYDGGMERDLLDRVVELDNESYEVIQLYPETADDR